MAKPMQPRPLEQVLFRLLLMRLFVPSLVVTLLAIGLAAYLEGRNLEYRRLQTARSLARSVENYLDSASKVIDAMALVAETTRADDMAYYLGAAQKAYGYFDVLYQLDHDGRIMVLSPPDPRFPPGFDMSYQPYFQLAKAQTGVFISEPFTSFRTGQPTVYMVKPAANDGLVVGELNLRALQQVIAPGGDTSAYFVFIADRSGRLLAHPQQELVQQQKNVSDMEIVHRGQQEEATLFYVADNTPMAGNAIPIKRAGWTLVSQIPLAAAYGPFLWSAGLALILLPVLWAILVLELRRFSQQIATPLARLSQSTHALAAGDYDQGTALAALPAAFAEVRMLASDFERMNQAIQARQTALQAAEAKNRALLNAIPDLMFLFDKEGLFLDYQADKDAGLLFPPEVFLGKRIRDIMPPEIADLTLQHLAQAFETNTTQVYEYPLKLNGDQRDFEARVVVCGQDQALAIVRDITERKQMESALRASEEKHRALFETMAQGVVYQAADGSITSANPAAERILGLTQAQMRGRTSLDPRWRAIHEDGSAFPGETHPAMVALRSGQPVRNVVMGVFHPARQDCVWINVNAVPQFRPGEARPCQVYTTFEDITQRKRVEEVLHRQNRYLTALQETTLDLISQFDLGNLLENIVRRAGQLMETSGGFLDLVEPETNQLRPQVGLGALAESLKFQAPLGKGLAGQVWKTGEPLVINDYDNWPGRLENFSYNLIRSVIGVPLLSGSRVLGVLSLAYDYTTDQTFGQEAIELLSQFARLAAIAIENARLVEALRRQTAELQARNQELDTFAHTVAHDLKSPLSLIIGYADLFGDMPEASSDEMRHTLQAIARNGRKMSNIIDELLLLSEVRSAEVPLSPVNMASVLAEVQERFAFEIQGRQAKIALPDTTAWPTVLGYVPWIEEVWANYISNALKYGGTPPYVELGATPSDDGRVRFWVRDNGRGLASEDQSRLFQPFARLDQVRAKGHGLGLSIVRRIVEKLGGQVSVESQPGQGSTFSFTLPTVPGRQVTEKQGK